MHFSIRLLAVVMLVWSASPTEATGCKTDCNRHCRVQLPFGGSAIEPACKADCEIKKAAACAAQRDVPDLPGSPSEVPGDLNRVNLAACAAEFEHIAKAVIVDCGRFRTPGMDREILDWTRRVLVNHGVLRREDLQNVEIRFCDLRGDTAGIVPNRNLIFLDDSYHPLRRDYDLRHRGLVGLGALLSHEMVHIAQYRREGTDAFKCRYAEEFKRTGGRQDRAHALEREAYDEEDQVYEYLEQRLRDQTCNSFGGLSCYVPGGYMGDPCYCPDGFGGEQKGLIGW